MALYDWEWVVQVNTLSGSGGRLDVDIDGRSTSIDVGAGLRQYQFAFTGEVPDSVGLSRTDDGSGTVCVAQVIVGTPRIAGG